MKLDEAACSRDAGRHVTRRNVMDTDDAGDAVDAFDLAGGYCIGVALQIETPFHTSSQFHCAIPSGRGGRGGGRELHFRKNEDTGR